MRKISKYDIFRQSNFLHKYPLRLLKFKRPRWLNLQKSILINQKKSVLSVQNYSKIKKNYKFLEKKKRHYKTGQIYKKILLCLFNNSLNLKRLKKKSLKLKKLNSFVNLVLAKNIFKIDILLWKLNFFSSSFEAKQFIYSKSLLLNGKAISSSDKYLKIGDVLSFERTELINSSFFKENLNKSSFINELLSFIEVDYYTGSIIIIKDFNSLTYEDINLILPEYIDIKKYSFIH